MEERDILIALKGLYSSSRGPALSRALGCRADCALPHAVFRAWLREDYIKPPGCSASIGLNAAVTPARNLKIFQSG